MLSLLSRSNTISNLVNGILASPCGDTDVSHIHTACGHSGGMFERLGSSSGGRLVSRVSLLAGVFCLFFFLSFWRKLQEQCLCSSAERGVVEVACVLGSSPHSRCSRDAGDLQELVSLGPLLWYRSEYRILCCCRLKLTLSFYLKQLCIFEKCNYQE